MQLIVTGGGTGGHVYPALEVARLAAAQGHTIRYFGSLRGQEGAACAARGVPFTGFPSEPFVSLRSAKGWKARAAMVRSVGQALAALRADRPDVIFSTGGYGAAPVLWAADRLSIPTVLLESNSIPGRTSRLFLPKAKSFGYVFRHTQAYASNGLGRRTGQPVRAALREHAKAGAGGQEPLVLVVGGSQGSAFLNGRVPVAAAELPRVRFLHATGRSHFEFVSRAVEKLALGERYRLVPYLDEAELLTAYRTATLAVARSGGTLAEFAVFGLPSVLVPLPQSADDHQRVNAQEFVQMHAATLCEQPSNDLAAQIGSWLESESRRRAAREALQAWDVPNATEQLLGMIEGAVG